MASQAARLRLATNEDASAVAEIVIAARRVAMPYLLTLYTDTEVLHWIEAVVLPESHVLLAVLETGQVAAFAAIRDNHLDHLYVAPMEQGRGIGARLLAAAQEVSAQGLRLHVFQRNARARLFYERRGFRMIELRNGSQNEERVPDAVYEWRP